MHEASTSIARRASQRRRRETTRRTVRDADEGDDARSRDARDGANVASIARVEGANAWDRCARDFLKIHGTLARGETSRWVETRARALEGSNSMCVAE